MYKIIYLKKINNYNEAIRNSFKVLIIRKIIFLYKSLFNKVIEKFDGNIHILILPFKNKISFEKLKKIIIKQIKRKIISHNTMVVLSEDLNKYDIENILKEYNIKIINGNLAKKILIPKALEYICKIKKVELSEIDITVLANNNNDINNLIIKFLAQNVKTLKIVSKNIYRFKNLEQDLYKNYGIAVQFSNSYKKSLAKSDLILNLDFTSIRINEYDINNKAIILNTENVIKIKSKLFNGVVINSYKIKLSRQIKKSFEKVCNFINEYDNLLLYESYIYSNDINYADIMEEKEIKIDNFIGNKGIINKQEFKNVCKKY